MIGNKYLYEERGDIYRALCCKLINPSSRPIILIDWSGVTHCGAFHMIRACLPINGRSITLYEEVYPESKKDSPKSNKIFLRNLAEVLPKNCCPIIVTDAGFRNPWFKEVRTLGWDFIGRIRGNAHIRSIKENTWKFCKDLYETATLNAKYLGEFLIARSNPIECKIHIIKDKCICESCGGHAKVIACIEDPVVINKILQHVALRSSTQTLRQ